MTTEAGPRRIDERDVAAWDAEVDVLVVGYGCAGVCAALEARAAAVAEERRDLFWRTGAGVAELTARLAEVTASLPTFSPRDDTSTAPFGGECDTSTPPSGHPASKASATLVTRFGARLDRDTLSGIKAELVG